MNKVGAEGLKHYGLGLDDDDLRPSPATRDPRPGSGEQQASIENEDDGGLHL